MVLGLLSGKKTYGDKGRAKHQTHQHYSAGWRCEMKATKYEALEKNAVSR